MKKSIISSFLLLLAAVIWGFAFVAQALSEIGSLTFTGLRFAIGALIMIPFFFIVSRKKTTKEKFKASMLHGITAGLLLFSAAILQQYAIDLGPGHSMKAGFITGLYTITVPIAGLIFMKKKTGVTTWIGVAAALVGLFLLCGTAGEALHFTDILLFISVPVWTAHILHIDHLEGHVDVFVFSFSQYAVCSLISLVGACIFEPDSLFSITAIGGSIWPILYGGVMSVGVAFTLQFVGQEHADPTVAAILLSTESMFSAIGNLLILSVDLRPIQFIGCGVIFVGIIVSQIHFGEHRHHHKHPKRIRHVRHT